MNGRRARFRISLSVLIAVAAALLVIYLPSALEYVQVRLSVHQMRNPEHRTYVEIVMTPGGEQLRFGEPARELIARGGGVREYLYPYLDDPELRGEIALVLGAIGDEQTVPLLIEAYPDQDGPVEFDPRNPFTGLHLELVLFTHALTYLTSEPIGRSRWGCDLNPENKRLWREWWAENQHTFWVSEVKPAATWVPRYPDP